MCIISRSKQTYKSKKEETAYTSLVNYTGADYTGLIVPQQPHVLLFSKHWSEHAGNSDWLTGRLIDRLTDGPRSVRPSVHPSAHPSIRVCWPQVRGPTTLCEEARMEMETTKPSGIINPLKQAVLVEASKIGIEGLSLVDRILATNKICSISFWGVL